MFNFRRKVPPDFSDWIRIHKVLTYYDFQKNKISNSTGAFIGYTYYYSKPEDTEFGGEDINIFDRGAGVKFWGPRGCIEDDYVAVYNSDGDWKVIDYANGESFEFGISGENKTKVTRVHIRVFNIRKEVIWECEVRP